MFHRQTLPDSPEDSGTAAPFHILADEPADAPRWERATGLQRAMLLSSLKSEGAYLQQLVVPLGALPNESLFLAAAHTCLQRHAGLMASFEFREGELWQGLLTEGQPPRPTIDLGNSAVERTARLHEFLEADRAEALPLLERRPLWRSRLLRFAADDLVWLWTHHHALCDAASYRPLLLEIFRTRDELQAGHGCNSAPAAPNFLDHLKWLSARDWAREAEAWRTRLHRAELPTSLPPFRDAVGSREIRSDARSLRVGIEIPPEVERDLRALCHGSELTLNTFVIAACALWLARMQNENKAVFAAMRAARKSSLPGAGEILGPLVNTLPLRIEVRDDLPLREWLRAVRRDWTELRELEHASLVQIAEWTGFGADGLELPVVINFQHERLPAQLRAAGLPAPYCDARLFQANDVPLMLDGCESPRFALDLIARKNSVSATTLRAAAGGLSAALRALAGDQNQPVGAIELLSPEDEKILEIATRGPKTEVPAGPAHALIEQQIRDLPDAIAIQQFGREISFRQLGEIADRVAENVAAHGGARAVVAILLGASAEIPCAVLGTLRAGAAFFLINPALPAPERAAMLARLPVALAIAAPEVAEETRALVPRVFTFAGIASATGTKLPPRPAIAPHDLAYLVHTSGSTGEKKFVEVEHHSLGESLHSLRRLYQYRPGDRRLSMGTPGNDYFISEILVALSGGATLIFREHAGALSITDYLAQIDRERITVSGIPAAYWHEWVRAMPEDRPADVPSTLRLLICSMEKANPQLLQKWRRAIGGRVRWLNVYGPAEATVAVTAWDPETAEQNESDNVPIGRPFGNSEVYLLDEKRRRLPVGAAGEIAIAGPPVARGYRGLEEETQRKFVRNPFARSPEFERMYLTGDYGYVNARGEFVFLERRDRQVKIRGHRVELGEIDRLLEKHPQIQQAVVTLEGDESDRYLVAHLVTAGGFDQRAMLDWMRTSLLPHLRPAEFVLRPEIPLMPTGKVDRAELSQSYRTRPAPEQASDVNPANREESILLSLWHELLGRHVAIGRNDNFFDFGGNSLLAVRLLSRLQNDFGIKLSVHDLFSHPTIEALARRLGPEPAEKQFTSLTPLNEGGAGQPLFIIHGWAGGVFHCLDFARRLNGARPVFGLQAVELAGVERHETFEEMAAHYAEEIVQAQPQGPYQLLGHSLGGMLAYATACELARRGATIDRLYIVDTTPFNLPRWVHLWHIAVQLRPGLVPHLKTFLRTWPRYWPRFIRARRRSLKARLRKWPAAANPAQKPLRPDADYYLVAARKFFPQRAAFEIRLFTPTNSPATETYWRYLTGGRVKKFPLHCGHIDMFTPEKLDNLVSAFARASQ